MRTIFLCFLFLIISCGSDKKEQVEVEHIHKISVTPTDNVCSWYILPFQYYNGVPKYSGTFCTYTHKHIPLAVQGKNSLFYTTTDNLTDDNFYVYAHKDDEKVLVHTIENWSDPHTNASIQIDNNGFVNVHVAARGTTNRFQSGKHLKSKTPYSLDFECLSGCLDVNFEAYPQAFDTKFGYYLGYTHYVKDKEIHNKSDVRELWYKIDNQRVRIAKGAHYQITYYQDGWVYVAYNWLEDASPEKRYNLYMIKTNNGVNWYTIENKPVTLPLEQDDDVAKIYDSKPNLVYLKDITAFNGVNVLFVESNSQDPTQGERHLKSINNKKQITTITDTNHNYSAAAYINHNDNLLVLANGNNNVPYVGGDINLYEYKTGEYVYKTKLSGANYSYIRKVFNTDSKAVAGEGYSDAFNGSSHVVVEIE